MRIHVLGVGFDNMTMEQAVAEGVRLMKEDVGGSVARTLLFDVESGLGCVRSYGRPELII